MGILTGGQGEEDIPGRVMSKHSDVEAESSKGFMGKSNSPIWPEERTWQMRREEACWESQKHFARIYTNKGLLWWVSR